jgi:hypothetical protein
MRAVEQIIRYLNEHGSLTREQLLHLERLGLWQGSAEELPAAEGPPVEVLRADDWEIDVERSEERAQRKGRRKSGARPADVTAEELAEHLTERFEAWRPNLEGLVLLGRRLGVCRNWEEAAVVVRNNEPEAVVRATVESLRTRSPSLKLLWTALGLEDYRDLPREWRRNGPAIGAYRTALTVQDYSEMNRDQWVLKQKAIGSVFNLRQAQLRLLRAAENVYRTQPDLIVNGFHRDYHPLAYWTFVILYNVRRVRRDGALLPEPASGEHGAMRGLPDERGWMLAESHAAWMDPIGYVRDLEAEQQRARQLRVRPEELVREYLCPRHWDHLTEKV